MSSQKMIRAMFVVTGVVNLFLAVAFMARWPWTRALWPWTGPYSLTGLSHLFIASILAAIGAPAIWLGFSGESGPATAGAINLAVTFLGAGLFMLQSYASRGSAPLLVGAAVCAAAVAGSVTIALVARRYPLRDSRPMPRPLRVAFAIFAVALLLVGPLLLLKVPNVFPWTLSAEASVVYGWVFIGAAAYFIYGLLRPAWSNACGQLLGFLAYDLVLIGPFIALFGSVRPANRPSLIVYTAVLVFSGAVAVYYLFINRATRLWRARPPQVPVGVAQP